MANDRLNPRCAQRNWCDHCKAPVISMSPSAETCITMLADCAGELERRRLAWLEYDRKWLERESDRIAHTKD